MSKGFAVNWDRVEGMSGQQTAGKDSGTRRLMDRIIELEASNAELLAALKESEDERCKMADTALAEVDRLRAVNAELLTALEGMVREWDKFVRYGSTIAKARNERLNAARVAIDKAKGEAC